ncbi:TPA: DUF551 domain-containing protein [Klebsiella pneumoniae]
MTSKLTSEILDDETLAELIAFRRSRVEYCQKEGLPYQKALHDSMMLALEELQERRNADSEPVAEVYQAPNVGICAALGPSIRMLCPLEPGTKLYRHAQQPLVPENCVTAEHRRVIEMLLKVCGAAFELADDSCQQDVDGEDCHVVPDDAFQKLSDALDEIENTLPTEDIDRPDVFLSWSAMPRAALKSLLQAQPVPVVPVVPDAYVRDEHGRMMLNGVCEPKIGFGTGRNACRAAMLQDGTLTNEGTSFQDNHSVDDTEKVNSPVIPDGYVLVPKEATEKMLIAGLEEANPLGGLIDWDASRGDCNTREQVQGMFEAMLAAAPQSPGGDHATVPGKWIPVSERMPDETQPVIVVSEGGVVQRTVYQFCEGVWNDWYDMYEDVNVEAFTHWMPLPAAPQEVKGE